MSAACSCHCSLRLHSRNNDRKAGTGGRSSLPRFRHGSRRKGVIRISHRRRRVAICAAISRATFGRGPTGSETTCRSGGMRPRINAQSRWSSTCRDRASRKDVLGRCAISGTTCCVTSLINAIKHSVAEVIPVCPYPRDTGFFFASTGGQVRAARRAARRKSGVIKEV